MSPEAYRSAVFNKQLALRKAELLLDEKLLAQALVKHPLPVYVDRLPSYLDPARQLETGRFFANDMFEEQYLAAEVVTASVNRLLDQDLVEAEKDDGKFVRIKIKHPDVLS